MQRYHEESFFLEYDNLGILTLCLKLHPNLAVSVVNGAPLTLVFRMPSIEQNNITLYIHDIPGNPFYITKTFIGDEGLESQTFPGLVNFVEYFQHSIKLCVAIFDETLKNIMTQNTDFELPLYSLSSWYKQNITTPDIPKIHFDSFQENDTTGYIINIRSLQHSEHTRYWNIALKNEWGENPYLSSTNKSVDHYSVGNYISTGVLGYLQEQNIKEIVSKFFMPDRQLFASPRLQNGLELIDIIFGTDGYLVLLESKTTAAYDGQIASVKARERALTPLINKASKQLINAERIVLESPLEIQDSDLLEHCIYSQYLVKVCVVNDTTLINKKSLSESLKQYKPEDLPIIMSLNTLYDILFKLQKPAKIVRVFHDIKLYLQKESELPILAGIKL